MNVILILLIMCVFYILSTNTSEYLLQDFTSEDPHKVLKINIPILQDSLFENTITFVNDDLWKNPQGKTGIEKCYQLCNGTCVEHGVTGTALCFV